MTVNANVIEPVSPYATDVFRADYPRPYRVALAAGFAAGIFARRR